MTRFINPPKEVLARWGTRSPEVIEKIGDLLHLRGWTIYPYACDYASFRWQKPSTDGINLYVSIMPLRFSAGVDFQTELVITSEYARNVERAAGLWENSALLDGYIYRGRILATVSQEWLQANVDPNLDWGRVRWNRKNTDEVAASWISQFDRYSLPFFENFENAKSSAKFIEALPTLLRRAPGPGVFCGTTPWMNAAFLNHQLGDYSRAIELANRSYESMKIQYEDEPDPRYVAGYEARNKPIRELFGKMSPLSDSDEAD